MSSLVRVLAAVIHRDGRYLLALRPQGKRHAGLWEFPGGKVEAGETDRRAMARELREELGVELVSLGRELCTQRDGDSPFAITFIEAQIDGEPQAIEHESIAWLTPNIMTRYPLAPSDALCATIIAAQPPRPRTEPPQPAWPRLTHLQRGERIVVRTAFNDFDDTIIETGREFTFSHYTFFPYDDGYTFFFEDGVFRLSGNESDNAAVLDNQDGRYFARVTA